MSIRRLHFFGNRAAAREHLRALYTWAVIPVLERLDWYRFLGRNRLPQPAPGSLEGFNNERILITGAAGSIGSALALRLAALRLAKLVLLDSSESRLFQLRRRWPAYAQVPVAQVLGNVIDCAFLDEIFSLHAPTLVFHAAAYKNVPLLEEHPLAAIANNVLGTQRVLAAAAPRRARVVLVSTDKAVNPASVLGATKRIAEYLVLAADGTALRLANVLGSRDSAAEVFSQQIAAGSALTVTDPAARRFFVTLEEAVDLLLAAAIEPRRHGLLVPDLEQSHFIRELAHFMSKELAPAESDDKRSSAQIKFTGLRPGDKQAEQLWADDETAVPAGSPGLLWIESRLPVRNELRRMFAALCSALGERDLVGALDELRAAIPSYNPTPTVLKLAAQAALRMTS